MNPWWRWAPVLVILAGCARGGAPGSPPVVSAPAGPSAAWFEDVTALAGLPAKDPPGAEPVLDTLATASGGGAFLDYDRDGHLDIVTVGSAATRLWRGDGRGRFEETTRTAGLEACGRWPMGVTCGDLDNDGWTDIVSTGYGRVMVSMNRSGRFVPVAAPAGIAVPADLWCTSAALGDIDGDGRLDVYVCGYLQTDPSNPRWCTVNGVRTACGPLDLPAQSGRLFRGLGAGRFRDVTRAWGVDRTEGRSLGALFWDHDGDGRIDLQVANDESPADLWRNTGKRFENVALAAGVSHNRDGHMIGGMGVATADVDGDLRPDLAVTTFAGEATCLYRQTEAGFFQDDGVESGVGAPTRPWVGFGCLFGDFDNDGNVDFATVNGHISSNAAAVSPGGRFAQPVQVFAGNGKGRFTEVPAGVADLVGRGLSAGDFDGDGRLDLLVVDIRGEARLLRNRTAGGNALRVRLIGKRSNRDGVGARVVVRRGDRAWAVQRTGGGSYQSASEDVLHIGLGAETGVDALEVRWPSGSVVRRGALPAGFVEVREP
ncbi:MAG: CRTAC1 family protein [Armatimonadota bacterium]